MAKTHTTTARASTLAMLGRVLSYAADTSPTERKRCTYRGFDAKNASR